MPWPVPSELLPEKLSKQALMMILNHHFSRSCGVVASGLVADPWSLKKPLWWEVEDLQDSTAFPTILHSLYFFTFLYFFLDSGLSVMVFKGSTFIFPTLSFGSGSVKTTRTYHVTVICFWVDEVRVLTHNFPRAMFITLVSAVNDDEQARAKWTISGDVTVKTSIYFLQWS